jgi:hypothetical protein
MRAPIPPRARPGNASRTEFLCWPEPKHIYGRGFHTLWVELVRTRPGQSKMRSVSCALGRSMYDYHSELPIDGNGISLDAILVLERDHDGLVLRTPYRAWRRSLGVRVLCPRCRIDLAPDTPDTRVCTRAPGRLRVRC